MNQAKKHCYLYTRVSTQMQVDGYSLDAQQDRLKKEAAAPAHHLWKITKAAATMRAKPRI